ncbi:4-hydroxythreonine-4-phosphate dehydrogenase PdxA [Litoreibacter janthinus]|uniref:4-hydroxythreonine-4-phosphate dehydrogenase n=1 Tax=Litoreibacter janthinus TaxID=670154 RepID=A0A1I6H0H1_9RHOB|nr:4-hydroxythreonine-4-phosphate dehydrogenase PdxA [Litoreibacter janthinus]SFR47771.1 4-hydroxythreonine-4-phosphate dehydrogenase [Litoreibacter janthinus]
MNTLSPVVVSCGEPAGVGLEIAHKAFDALRDEVPIVLLADRRHVTGPVTELGALDHFTGNETALPLLHHDFAGTATPGQPDPRNAQGVIDVIARGVDFVTKGDACALCTLPIHKKALKDGAAFAYPGHTEYLAALAGVERVVMMLACPDLRVVPVTIHIAIDEVPNALTSELLENTIRITHDALRRDFGIDAPRLAVAGLNPHAGEGGAMGHEEITLISPLLERLSQDGLQLSGPMSADTMFHAQARAHYDAAICMYHDQALIPIKTIDFAGGVNVTLGLPFIRTSPDHGTAFDIAGTGVADATSTIAALRMAWDMSGKRGH